MTPPREITEDELDPLATGAWILGAGGGGDPHHALLNMKRLYREGVRVKLMSPDDLADDALVAVVSTMGAPLVGEERLTDPRVAALAVDMMEEYLGRPFDAVMSLEIGGANSLQPFMVAAVKGLPVVDADTMGRAYPEAQMSSFAIGDLQPWPLTLADVRNNAVVVSRAATWKWMERLSRKACTEVGSLAATCKAPRTGREVKDWGILHTVTQAIRLGRAVLDARARKEDPVEAAVRVEGGKVLFHGKVTDVERRTTGGFLRGTAKMEGLGPDQGHGFVVDFQNEFSVGWRDGEPVVFVPEIITIMDSTTGDAIGTESLRYGQRVRVVVFPAPELQKTPKGLEHVGPRAFGYDLDFRSVFDGAAPGGAS
ncbi:MAG: DUF917 domain-containing protein [Gemmatimonadota bacterium]|nr:DUF917 domain-containing protein [Gemmatimonadota bacterium]